jgi:hypothetical protein
MNPQLKTIIFKEIKEVSGRRDYLLNIIPFLALAFLFVVGYTGPAQKLIMEFSFISLPSFTMLIMGLPLIQEKFGDEKLLRNFEVILTTPISLKTVWAGKMVSIFLLSYPAVIILIFTLFSIWNILTGLNPIFILSSPVWIMTLIITPLIPMVYDGFSSWFILRFSHPKLVQILLYFAVGGGVVISIISTNLVKHITSEQIVNWTIIACSALIIAAAFSLILILVNRLDKEKITI